jgi:probable HAF family extracellular repeat protein
MRWTKNRRHWTLASAVALALPLLVSDPSATATETATAGHPLEIVDLGALPDGLSSFAVAINDRGSVVGMADADNLGTAHAFLWRNGRMADLGSLAGPLGNSSANDVNNKDEVVGSSTPSDQSQGSHAFLWRHGRMIDLGTLGGTLTVATDINDRSEVVGYSLSPGEWTHAFLWRNGRMTDLGSIDGAPFATAEAINNRGQIVGYAGGPATWQHGVPTRLPFAPGAVFGTATDNNKHGDVVGFSGYEGGTSINRAVIWQRGVPTDLGLDGGISQAQAVNNHRQVIGTREFNVTGEVNAYLWDQGRVTNLVSLTGHGGQAFDINDRIEIVGNSPTGGEYVTHAVLWH